MLIYPMETCLGSFQKRFKPKFELIIIDSSEDVVCKLLMIILFSEDGVPQFLLSECLKHLKMSNF